jgi:hypothetical protein
MTDPATIRDRDDDMWAFLEGLSDLGEATVYEVYRTLCEDMPGEYDFRVPLQTCYRVSRQLEGMGILEIVRLQPTREGGVFARVWAVTALGRLALGHMTPRL